MGALSAFLDGAMLGLGAAVPIGPVNLLIMAAALRRFHLGVLVGIGAMCADLTYLLLILVGVFALVESPLFYDSVALLGGLFLLWLAWQIFARRNTPMSTTLYPDIGPAGTWIRGYLVTLFSPYTIAFWVSASTLAATRHSDQVGVLMGGMMIAIGVWVLLLPAVIHKSRGLLSPALVRLFALLSSIVLVWIGGKLLIGLM